MRLSARRITAGALSTGLAIMTAAGVLAAPSMAEGDRSNPAIPLQQPAPARLWSSDAIRQLRSEALAAAGEGLDPTAYDLAGLAQAAAFGLSTASDRAATKVALALANDYASGRITEKRRLDWHIGNTPDLNRLANELNTALREGNLQPWLRSLLPQDDRYAALRAAYAATPAEDRLTRDRIRANLERWRWMPRQLGRDHIFVNVPSYNLNVVDEGRVVSTYTVVVGKPSTPTPQIAMAAQSIVVNPWWNVPPSISRKMGDRKGFISGPDGALRQPPGPRNALGKVKIDMPNPHSIYLHDTPSKALFAKSSRAFSHGCIRVKDIDRLAAELVTLDKGNSREVQQALAGSATTTVRLSQTRPVYLVYFTAEVGSEGNIVAHEDPYGRDKRLLAALDGATLLAARSHKRPMGSGLAAAALGAVNSQVAP